LTAATTDASLLPEGSENVYVCERGAETVSKKEIATPDPGAEGVGDASRVCVDEPDDEVGKASRGVVVPVADDIKPATISVAVFDAVAIAVCVCVAELVGEDDRENTVSPGSRDEVPEPDGATTAGVFDADPATAEVPLEDFETVGVALGDFEFDGVALGLAPRESDDVGDAV
jgi:hypothetical protein